MNTSESFSDSEESVMSDNSDYDFIPEILPPFLENSDVEDLYQDGDYPGQPYSNEPLADDEWIRQYEIEQAERDNELRRRKSRLDGTTLLSDWCKCGHCKIELLQNPDECHCCREIQKCVEILTAEEVLEETQDEPPVCVTLHPAFPILCLNKWSLKSAAVKYRRIDRTKYTQTGSEEAFLRSVSYREFVQLVYGHLGETRLPLPACAYSKIRSTFRNDSDEPFFGFEEEN